MNLYDSMMRARVYDNPFSLPMGRDNKKKHSAEQSCTIESSKGLLDLPTSKDYFC